MKKQVLFLITLLLAITPACKQQHKRAGADITIAAGTISTATGIAVLGAGVAPTALLCAVSGIAAPLVAVVLGSTVLISAGIAGIVKGAQKRKKLKKQERLEKLLLHHKESEEIQNLEQENNLALNESK